MELFRREALDGQDRLHGDIVFVPQVSWRLLGVFFAAALALTILYLSTAHYRPATLVAGRLAAQDGSLVALFEVPAAAAEPIVPGQSLRLSAPGASRVLDGRVAAVVPSRNGMTIVRVTLDGGAAPQLRPGMTVRAPLRARSRTLASWLADRFAGRGGE